MVVGRGAVEGGGEQDAVGEDDADRDRGGSCRHQGLPDPPCPAEIEPGEDQACLLGLEFGKPHPVIDVFHASPPGSDDGPSFPYRRLVRRRAIPFRRAASAGAGFPVTRRDANVPACLIPKTFTASTALSALSISSR